VKRDKERTKRIKGIEGQKKIEGNERKEKR
jgi:hypothetical protein